MSYNNGNRSATPQRNSSLLIGILIGIVLGLAIAGGGWRGLSRNHPAHS